MDPNIGIKSFAKPQKQAFPTCYVCGKNVRFPAKCDNCGNTVCNRHRPAFVKPWYCSKCQEMWSQWRQNNMAGNSGENVMNQAMVAENLYSDYRIVEAEKIIDDIFEDLMSEGNKDVAAEIITTERGDTVNG